MTDVGSRPYRQDPEQILEWKQEQWPRQWAMRIHKLPKEQRQEALSLVPEEYREWVRDLLETFERQDKRR
jgi:hypothetical protein